LDFRDPDDMKRAYPRLFARFGAKIYAPNPYDDLLERCRKYAGAKKKRWSESDVADFFQRFRPSGEGLEEIYAGVEHGEEIARRIAAAMKIDGTTKGTTLTPNKLTAVTGHQATAIVEQFCANVQSLTTELNDPELAERFTVNRFVLRAGERDDYKINDATNEAIEMLRDALFNVFYEAAAPASVLSNAVHSLVGQRMLPYYMEWPICAARFKINDPLAPVFAMWRSNMAWRFSDDGAVEVFTP
jgi:hypothetical protein